MSLKVLTEHSRCSEAARLMGWLTRFKYRRSYEDSGIKVGIRYHVIRVLLCWVIQIGTFVLMFSSGWYCIKCIAPTLLDLVCDHIDHRMYNLWRYITDTGYIVVYVFMLHFIYVIWRTVNRFCVDLMFPLHDWEIPFMPNLLTRYDARCAEPIKLHPCTGHYQEPKWVTHLAYPGYKKLPVYAADKYADSTVVLSQAIPTDTFDDLKDRLPFGKKVLKKSVATAHILNDVAYKETLSRIEHVNLSGRVVAEIGGHKASVYKNSIRIVADLEQGDGIRSYAYYSRHRNEREKGESHEWSFTDFFKYRDKLDVVICVFVMGMDMRRFFAHCYNLGVDTIIFTTAATSNFIKRGFMCTSTSQMLTVVSGDKVLSMFNETDKIYEHDIVDYFIPLLVGNIVFDLKYYYRREPLATIDSNLIYMYTLQDAIKCPKTPIKNTFCRGLDEHWYVMLDPVADDWTISYKPLAIPTAVINEIKSFASRVKYDTQKLEELVVVVHEQIAAHHPLTRDGGFLKMKEYIPEVAAAIAATLCAANSRFALWRYIRDQFSATVLWSPKPKLLIETPVNINVGTSDMYIKKEEIRYYNDKNELKPAEIFGENVDAVYTSVEFTNEELRTYSWLDPTSPRKDVKIGDTGEASAVLIHGGAHVRHLFYQGKLKVQETADGIFCANKLVARLDGRYYGLTPTLNRDTAVTIYDCFHKKVVGFEAQAGELTEEEYTQVTPVELFVVLFIGVVPNNAVTQCYRVAWGLPTVPPVSDLRGDVLGILTAETSNEVLFVNGRYYAAKHTATNAIISINKHAYKMLGKFDLGEGAVLDPKQLANKYLPNGQPIVVEEIEKARLLYQADIDKLKVPQNQPLRDFKKSIKNYFAYESEHEIQWLGKLVICNTPLGVDKLKSDGLVTVYDNNYGHVVGTSNGDVQDVGWDGEKYVEKGTGSTEFPTTNRYVFMSEDLTFLRALDIKQTLHIFHSILNREDFSGIDMLFLNGVPGCGKTYTIANECRGAVAGEEYMSPTNLILTASVGGKAAYEAYPWINQKQVKTYDSILINYEKFRDSLKLVTHLYCDEAMMAHFGEVLSVIALVKPAVVRLYGDKQQIPFLNRVVGFKLECAAPHSILVKDMNTTYRSPAYMKPYLQLFYPRIEMFSNYMSSEPQVIGIKLQTKLLLNDYDRVLTFTQFEKSMLLEMGNKHTNTIHEMQGSSHDKVAIVRFIIQENTIYQSAAHIIVAISRHKYELTYFTVDTKDMLSKLLREKKLSLNEKPFVTETATYFPQRIPIIEIARPLVAEIPTPPGVFATFLTDNYTPVSETIYRNDERFFRPWERPAYTDPPIYAVNSVLGVMFEPYDPDKAKRLEAEIVNDIPKSFKLNLLKFAQALNKTDNRVFCEPQMNTPIHPIYRGQPGTLIHAIRKRNADPPTLLLANAWANYVSIAARWFDVFVDKEKFGNITFDYGNNIFFRHWYSTRDSNQRAALYSDAEKYSTDPRRYNGILKPLPKPVLNNAHNLTLAAPQVITSMQALPTVHFAQYMRGFAFYLRKCLKPNWHINDGFDGPTLSAIVNNLLADSVTGKVKLLESDISKFDKSQELGSLIVVSEIYRKFKMPEHIIHDWEECHIRNFLVFKQSGISLYTDFQRRSGDIMTFIGNTLVTMALSVDAFELERALGGVFGGDDSLVAFESTVDVADTSERVTNVFNFMIKLEHFPTAITFASKFLIYWEGGWVLMPDGFKVITKLGRNDVFNKEHAALYHISFKSTNRLYAYPSLRHAMAVKLVERYGKDLHINLAMTTVICEFIGSLLDNKKKFLSLFKMTPDNTFKQPLPTSFITKYHQEMQYTTKYDSIEDYVS